MDYEAIARQLRKPVGDVGKQVGEKMNVGNERINLRTLEILDAKANENILEIGMGNGFFVKKIITKSDSIHYTGCDFSETMVEEATRLNQEFVLKGNLRFVLGSADNLPFTDNTFDKIFTINTIYFWEDPKMEFAEIKRVLKAKGQLIISIRPKSTMIQYRFTKYGFNFFEKEDLSGLLSVNGFNVISTIQENEANQNINGEEIRVDSLIVKAGIA